MPSRPPVFRPAHIAASPTVDEERGTARDRGYSAKWDTAARLYRRRHPLCLGCEAIGRVVPTTVVDHIRPHKGNQALFWDADNWQPACDAHHAQVKPRLERLFAQGRLQPDDLRLDSAVARKLTLELMV